MRASKKLFILGNNITTIFSVITLYAVCLITFQNTNSYTILPLLLGMIIGIQGINTGFKILAHNHESSVVLLILFSIAVAVAGSTFFSSTEIWIQNTSLAVLVILGAFVQSITKHHEAFFVHSLTTNQEGNFVTMDFDYKGWKTFLYYVFQFGLILSPFYLSTSVLVTGVISIVLTMIFTIFDYYSIQKNDKSILE